jgi:hypothetical protein
MPKSLTEINRFTMLERVKDLQAKHQLTEGERIELDLLLKRKWEMTPHITFTSDSFDKPPL